MSTSSVITASTTTAHERRPWGEFEVLDEGPGYKVKRLSVAPRARISLQRHHFRAEHWFVVEGTATCTVADARFRALVGEHVHVPCGAVHRLANEESGELMIVEVQLGSYTGEDDIVRLHDDHGRS